MESCRICRGEATASQPLLHPCRCRGLIKYIHQDCLMEWLKHLNKSTLRCDICNTPYKFRTIYDPKMPSRMPFKYLWHQFVQTVQMGVIRVLLVFLYVTCVLIFVPVQLKFCGRIFTWLIDGRYPRANDRFWDALFFGEHDINHEVGINGLANLVANFELNSTYAQKLLLVFRLFAINTYLPGLGYVFALAALIIALFIEHEYLVRDPGFAKMLLRDVGDEPRVKLMEVLEHMIEGMRGANTEQLQRAIHDLGNDGRLDNMPEEALRRFIEVRQRDTEGTLEAGRDRIGAGRDRIGAGRDGIGAGREVVENGENVFEEEEVEEDDDDEDYVNEGHDLDEDLDEELAGDFDGDFDDHNDVHHFAAAAHDEINPQINIAPLDGDNISFDDINEIDLDDPEPEQAIQNDQDIGNGIDDFGPEDEDEIHGDIFDLFQIDFNLLVTPLIVMAIGCLITTLSLTLVFLIPHLIGLAATSVILAALKPLKTVLMLLPLIKVESDGAFVVYLVDSVLRPALIMMKRPFLSKYEGVTYVDGKPILLSPDKGNTSGFTIMADNTTKPDSFFGSYIRYHFIDPPNDSFSLTFEKEVFLSERIFYVVMGYAVIIFAIHHIMTKISSGRKPILGTPRKLYKVLFEIAMTAKVFVVFTVDVICFPMYCGWLFDFCISPLLLENFVLKELPYINLFWCQLHIGPQGFFPNMIAYWFLGTFYMVFFALFVGMTREKIMRKGVLYFIRLPEDPNTRLIHDALTQPLRLQLLRIKLSAKGYSAFILVFIGLVTWTLRLMLPTLFPLRLGSLGKLSVESANETLNNSLANYPLQYVFPCLALFAMSRETETITKIVCWYWTKVFALCCHRLRLSHFILGRPIAQERGYVVYRNWWEQILATAQPDFSKPATLKEARRLFQETSTRAVFVPNGCYVRAPDSDASRKFIKTMFVVVTKDDQVIPSLDQKQPLQEEGNRQDYGYELDDEDNYTNTYSILYRPPFLKVRATVLVFMLWAFATFLILGVVFVALFVGKSLVMGGKFAMSSITRQPATVEPDQADIIQIILGLLLIQNCIVFTHERLHSTNFNFFNALRKWLGPIVLGFSYCFVVIVWANWIARVHKWCIDLPFRRFLAGKAESYESGDANEFLVLRGAILFHLGGSLFTLLPFCRVALQIVKDYFASRSRFWLAKYVWKNYIVSTAGYLLVTVMAPSFLGVYWPAIGFGLFASCKVILGAVSLHNNLSATVKNQVYLKGKAIENHDMD